MKAALKNVVIVGRAGAAWDELARWDTDLAQQQADLADAIAAYNEDRKRQHKTPRQPRVSVSTDPLDQGYSGTDHAALVHTFALEVIREHSYYLTQGQSPELNSQALAAWRLICRTRERDEIERRLRIAIAASARLVPACQRVADER